MSNSNLHCLKIQGPRAFKHLPLFFASFPSFLFESYLERAFKSLLNFENWQKKPVDIHYFSYFWALRAQKRPPPLPPPSPSLNARGGTSPPFPPLGTATALLGPKGPKIRKKWISTDIFANFRNSKRFESSF